jgi:hypothetical protein
VFVVQQHWLSGHIFVLFFDFGGIFGNAGHAGGVYGIVFSNENRCEGCEGCEVGKELV